MASSSSSSSNDQKEEPLTIPNKKRKETFTENWAEVLLVTSKSRKQKMIDGFMEKYPSLFRVIKECAGNGWYHTLIPIKLIPKTEWDLIEKEKCNLYYSHKLSLIFKGNNNQYLFCSWIENCWNLNINSISCTPFVGIYLCRLVKQFEEQISYQELVERIGTYCLKQISNQYYNELETNSVELDLNLFCSEIGVSYLKMLEPVVTKTDMDWPGVTFNFEFWRNMVNKGLIISFVSAPEKKKFCIRWSLEEKVSDNICPIYKGITLSDFHSVHHMSSELYGGKINESFLYQPELK